VGSDAARTRTFDIISGRGPIQIENIRTDHPGLVVKTLPNAPTDDGSTHHFEMTLDPSLPEGNFNGKIFVKTDMANQAELGRGESLRLAGACAGLLALSAVLGVTVNLLRPLASRLPWAGDWDDHIETKAYHAGIPLVFLAGAKERIAEGSAMLFDARTPEQYAAGHLPGARNLPLHEVDERLAAYASLLTMQTPIWVYCGGAECGDALELAIQLRTYGFEDLTLYPGGFAEWTEYGEAIHTGEMP